MASSGSNIDSWDRRSRKTTTTLTDAGATNAKNETDRTNLSRDKKKLAILWHGAHCESVCVWCSVPVNV